MNHSVRSLLESGMDGIPIDIECQLSNGLPSIVIVGLGSRSIDEAKERIRSAFASSGLKLPRKRITINLAPADVRKESTSFDLAIAAAIIVSNDASNKISIANDTAIIGEVGLSGTVRPVRGIIGKLIAGKKLGFNAFFIPEGNLAQAQLVPGVTLYTVKNLSGFYGSLLANDFSIHRGDVSRRRTDNSVSAYQLSSVTGQNQAKRAIELAAAGGHNILLYGPPGTGKSMLARTLSGLLPPLTHQEMLEITHIHSLASQAYDQLITERPFRSPHHSSSSAAIIGGGSSISPGELSLSHRGVFFMDEMPEFDRRVLEALRQPLEEHTVKIARAKQNIEYPANFILVATANPCPCGFYGSHRECICTAADINRYQKKLSGPILDRIDLFVMVGNTDHTLLLNPAGAEDEDKKYHESINRARATQRQRFGTDSVLNATMGNTEVKKLANITPDAVNTLNAAASRLSLSPRAYMRTIKVARTIADIEKSKMVLASHVAESLQYREVRFTNR